MSLISWFNSADQVDTALIVVAIIGAIIETGVAVAAVINVHKEFEESRKVKLEKYIEVFACIAAFFFLAEAILGCRSSVLLGIELEKLKTENLVLEAKLQPRIITPKNVEDFIFLTAKTPKFPIRVSYGETRSETMSYAWQIRQMLNAAKFPPPDSDTNLPFEIFPREGLIGFPATAGDPIWNDVEFFCGNTNDFKNFRYLGEETSNGLVQLAVPNWDTNDTFGVFVHEFMELGITVKWSYQPNFVSPNTIEIFIRPKSE